MPVFVSYNPADYSLAEAVKAGIAKFEPKTTFAFSPIKPGQGYWLPKFGEAIREADAFVLTVGPAGITPQQEREAYEAFDRRAQDSRFPFVVPIAGGYAPGLPFLGDLTWIEASEIANDAVRQRILAALKGEPGAMVSPRWKLVRPYRGRQPMTTSDTGWFHGRTAETDAVLTALHRHNERLPVLIGEAGVGKSSVAQAGVLAALTAMRRPGGSGSWPDGFRNSRGGWALLTVRPGDAPLEALAAAFIQLCYANPNDAECQALTRTWTDNLKGAKTLSDLMETTRQRLNDSDRTRPARVLLYLDGLDELYTRAARTSPKEARAFSQVLADGLGDPDLFAVASFRSEEIEALDADDGLSQIYDAIEMPRLTEAQLLEVATGPAKSLGVAFEDAQAPQRLVGGFAKESDALPRLSEGLAGLWSEMTARGDGVLRLPTSGDPGGVGVQPDPPP
ncbi:MAG: toll/interleukin-1 receptor domain-containing protein, partial [Hyphomicrobiaceae bacterium]